MNKASRVPLLLLLLLLLDNGRLLTSCWCCDAVKFGDTCQLVRRNTGQSSFPHRARSKREAIARWPLDTGSCCVFTYVLFIRSGFLLRWLLSIHVPADCVTHKMAIYSGHVEKAAVTPSLLSHSLGAREVKIRLRQERETDCRCQEKKGKAHCCRPKTGEMKTAWKTGYIFGCK